MSEKDIINLKKSRSGKALTGKNFAIFNEVPKYFEGYDNLFLDTINESISKSPNLKLYSQDPSRKEGPGKNLNQEEKHIDDEKASQTIKLTIRDLVSEFGLERVKQELFYEGVIDDSQPVTREKRKRRPTSLPPLPSGMTWPTETFSRSSKINNENIVDFLNRVWVKIIETGLVSFPILRAIDPSAAIGVTNYTRPDKKTGERRQLPPHLHIRTLPEINNQALAKEKPARIVRDPRLAQAAANRARKALRASQP